MKLLICLFTLCFYSIANAGQCYQAFKKAKKLEAIVSGVEHTSETDSSWEGFASWVPIKNTTNEEIKRVLNLKKSDDIEEALYEVESSEKAYEFLKDEIETLEHYAQDGYGVDSPAKLKRLLKIISNEFGDNIRLVMNGSGYDRSVFIGNHVIVLIMPNGCLAGLKVFTVWT